MYNFYEWMKLSESVTFSVADVGRQPPKDMLELSTPLTYKVAEQFPDLWKKIGLPEVITPDGDYIWNNDKGIMNFYARNLTDEEAQKILKAIAYYVKELGGQVTGQPKREISNLWKDTPVYRIPIEMTQQSQERPPELNLANRNAFELLKMLGYKPDYAGTLDVRDLLMRISRIGDFEKQMMSQAPSKEKGGLGTTIHDGGISHDQIDRYLQELEKMARWAMQKGFDRISFA